MSNPMFQPLPSRPPSGCRVLHVRYPVAMARHALHLPPLLHEGVTYVPFTGRIIGRTSETRGVYEMEYRALREETACQTN